MDSIEEKRVYDDRTGRRDVYVATGAGVARVAVSGTQVGEFGLVHRGEARDVAGADGELLVATPEAVLRGTEFAPTGFGPAVAVAVDDGGPVAAGPDGRVARFAGGEWTTLATVPDVRAMDGDLLAAADGVHRVDGAHVGLSAARDVAAAGPLAATDDGLYRLGNGWLAERDGAFALVTSDGERAHAATADACYARAGGEWRELSLPVDEPVRGVGYGETVYAVTDRTFLVRDGEEWRTQPLGLPDVAGLAVP